MLNASENADNIIKALAWMRDKRATDYALHRDPGGLTRAEIEAWHLENRAHLLFLQAAQIRLDAELELRELMRADDLP